MPTTHQAVQACHASVAAGRDLVRCKDPYLILVTVPDRAALVALSVRLTVAGIAHRVFQEDDMGGRPTALATRPIVQKERRWLRELPLYAPVAQRVSNGLEERVA